MSVDRIAGSEKHVMVGGVTVERGVEAFRVNNMDDVSHIIEPVLLAILTVSTIGHTKNTQ